MVDGVMSAPERYRNWLIEESFIGLMATHPEYDGPEDKRIVSAANLEGIKVEIDEWYEENPDD